MIVYYKLDTLLSERKITKTQLCKDTGVEEEEYIITSHRENRSDC